MEMDSSRPRIRYRPLHDFDRRSDAEQRHQVYAALGAKLARLRVALNRWWSDSDEGSEPMTGPAVLELRALLREASDEAERTRALRRGR